MYFDEDGDLAHEFYEEVIPGKKSGSHSKGSHKSKPFMRKVTQRRLRPQGEVPYSHPRLHVDFPIILYQG